MTSCVERVLSMTAMGLLSGSDWLLGFAGAEGADTELDQACDQGF
jgi:hypothetical protein